jgi:hypothetical protein
MQQCDTLTDVEKKKMFLVDNADDALKRRQISLYIKRYHNNKQCLKLEGKTD